MYHFFGPFVLHFKVNNTWTYIVLTWLAVDIVPTGCQPLGSAGSTLAGFWVNNTLNSQRPGNVSEVFLQWLWWWWWWWWWDSHNLTQQGWTLEWWLLLKTLPPAKGFNGSADERKVRIAWTEPWAWPGPICSWCKMSGSSKTNNILAFCQIPKGLWVWVSFVRAPTLPTCPHQRFWFYESCF